MLLSHYFQPDNPVDVREAALDDWIEALLPFPQPAIENAAKTYLRDQPRRRPTPGDIRERASSFRKEERIASQPAARGDRSTLSHDEIVILDTQVLPAARRWVTEIPGLAEQGAKTLGFWGEPVPQPNVLPKTRDEREAAVSGFRPKRMTQVDA